MSSWAARESAAMQTYLGSPDAGMSTWEPLASAGPRADPETATPCWFGVGRTPDPSAITPDWAILAPVP